MPKNSKVGEGPAHDLVSSAFMTTLINQAAENFYGQREELKLALCCLLSQGHLLIEGMPGIGKTTMAKTLAHVVGLPVSRIQFTSDLLPADILGVSIFKERENLFQFQPGPIFSSIVLGDELNRASPKTQSACLEAMQERQITVDGKTHALPKPFFFIATQNPRLSIGTFPLPGSQLDRFAMRLQLGYPSEDNERSMLLGDLPHGTEKLTKGEALLKTDFESLFRNVGNIYVAKDIADYILRLVRASRSKSTGLSPRAGLDLLKGAKAWAFIEGRDFVIPEDVKSVFVATANHRICDEDGEQEGTEVATVLLNRISVPTTT